MAPAPPPDAPHDDGEISVVERLERLEREMAETRDRVRTGEGRSTLRLEVAQQRLRRKDSDLEAAGGGSWSWRPERGEPRFSPACHRVLGLGVRGLARSDAALEAVGADTPAREGARALCMRRLHPADQQAFDRELEAFLHDGHSRFHQLVRVKHDGGHWVGVIVAAGVTDRRGDGAVARVAGVVLEADAEGRWRTDLADRSEELDALARLANHDLRSPLRTITGFAEHLLPALAEDPRSTDLLDRILLAGERMRVLVDRVLILASLGHDLQIEAIVDLGAVAREAARRVQRRPGAVEAEIQIGELPSVEGHEAVLTHVFEQLFDNASKHGGTGRVGVEVEEDDAAAADGRVRLLFRDGGEGLDPVVAEQLFESHRQRGEQRQSGPGLGLSIVRRAVEKHGGTVSAEPAPDGPGNRIVLTLPRRQPPRTGERRAVAAD